MPTFLANHFQNDLYKRSLCCNKDFLSLSIFFLAVFLSLCLYVCLSVRLSVSFSFFYGNFVLICLTFTFMFQNFQFLRSSEEDKCGSSKECVPITQCTEMILLINKVKMKCNEKISIMIKENNRRSKRGIKHNYHGTHDIRW